MTAHMRLFVFGLGYSAAPFARAMRDKGAWVGGTLRSVDKAVALATDRLCVSVFDGASPGIGVGAAVRHATHLVVSIAPGEADPVLAHHRDAVLAAPGLRWIGYLSTVGVYGDRGGAWVDETAAPQPSSGRSIRRLAAEEAWRAVARDAGAKLAVFRIAGIYGPGRNALVNLAEGRAKRVVKPGQVFNRIHVDDIVTVLAAAAEREAEGVFNLADDEPAPPQDVVAFAAGLMGVEPPPEVPFEEADLTPMARSFYGDNKRVSNGRIERELKLGLRFPTYREGLTAMWRGKAWR